MHSKGLHTRTLIAIALSATVAACSDDPSGPSETNGRLQVIPGVAAVPLVDVAVDGVVKLRNVAHGVPSQLIPLSLGAHTVKIVAAGSAVGTGGITVTLRANDTTQVVAIGTANQIAPIALGDTGATPVAGKGKLRVSHLASNAPPIDVYRSQPDFQQFTKVMSPFPFQASSPFLESTPGNWVVRVTVRDATTVVAESAPIRVDALWVRTVLILDKPGGGIKIVPLGEQ